MLRIIPHNFESKIHFYWDFIIQSCHLSENVHFQIWTGPVRWGHSTLSLSRGRRNWDIHKLNNFPKSPARLPWQSKQVSQLPARCPSHFRGASGVMKPYLITPYLKNDFLCIPKTSTLSSNVSILLSHYLETVLQIS